MKMLEILHQYLYQEWKKSFRGESKKPLGLIEQEMSMCEGIWHFLWVTTVK
ncbi:MAG: hypothetical protein ACK502_10330 [Alphaproteobacteria bacterium]|jgi:hypothetical protein